MPAQILPTASLSPQSNGVELLLNFQQLLQQKQKDDFNQKIIQQQQNLLQQRQPFEIQQLQASTAAEQARTTLETDQDAREAALSPLMVDDWKQKLKMGDFDIVDKQATSALNQQLVKQQILNEGLSGKAAQFKADHLQPIYDQEVQQNALQMALVHTQIDKQIADTAESKHRLMLDDADTFQKALASGMIPSDKIAGIKQMYKDNPLIQSFTNDPQLDPDLAYVKSVAAIPSNPYSTPEEIKASNEFMASRTFPNVAKENPLDGLAKQGSGEAPKSNMEVLGNFFQTIQSRRNAAREPGSSGSSVNTPSKNLVGEEVLPYTFNPTGVKDVDTVLSSIAKDTNFSTIKVSQAQQLPRRQADRLDGFLEKQPLDHKPEINGDRFKVPDEVIRSAIGEPKMVSSSEAENVMVSDPDRDENENVIRQNAIIDKNATIGQNVAFQTIYNKLVGSLSDKNIANRLLAQFDAALPKNTPMLTPLQIKAIGNIGKNFDLGKGGE